MMQDHVVMDEIYRLARIHPDNITSNSYLDDNSEPCSLMAHMLFNLGLSDIPELSEYRIHKFIHEILIDKGFTNIILLRYVAGVQYRLNYRVTWKQAVANPS